MTQREQYIEWIRYGRKLSENSIKSIESDFNQFGDKLETATRRDVELFIMEQNKKGMSTASVARRASSLKGFFDYQIYNELRTGLNPINSKTIPRVSNTSHTALSYKQLESLYTNTSDTVLKVAISLAGYAGLRLSEITTLKYEDLYYDTNGDLAVHLKNTKGNKERHISLVLTPDKKLIVNTYRQGGLKSQRGNYSSNGLWRKTSRYFSEQGFKDLSMHALRKTFATVVTKAGLHSIFTRDLLGHSSIDGNFITSKYLGSTTVEEQAQALQQLQL